MIGVEGLCGIYSPERESSLENGKVLLEPAKVLPVLFSCVGVSHWEIQNIPARWGRFCGRAEDPLHQQQAGRSREPAWLGPCPSPTRGRRRWCRWPQGAWSPGRRGRARSRGPRRRTLAGWISPQRKSQAREELCRPPSRFYWPSGFASGESVVGRKAVKRDKLSEQERDGLESGR